MIESRFPELSNREWLRDHCLTMTTGQIARLLGCSVSRVDQAKRDLGVRSDRANRFRDRTMCGDQSFDESEAERRRKATRRQRRAAERVETVYGEKILVRM